MSETASNVGGLTDINIESEQSVLKRKLTSKVWLEFKKIKDASGNFSAICNHCGRKFTAASSSGTTHLRNHLNRCPVRANKAKGQLELQPIIEQADNNILKLQNFKFDQEKSRMDMSRMVMKHNYPFNMVEHELFAVFVNNLQPRFRIHSRNTLRADIMKLYEVEKKVMYKLLDELPSRVSLTTDLWTSDTQKVAYCSLTCHFIDNNWVLKKKIIAFPNVESKHDGLSLFEIIKNLLLEWNIEKKVFSLTVDNATSNDVMTRTLKSWLNGLKLLPLDGDIFHIRCAAHILNLIVQDGLKSIENVLKKIRDSVIYVNSSPQRKQQFENVMNQLKMQSLRQPGDDVPTRWNSTYLMLESAISIKCAFSRLEQVDKKYKLNPSSEEWEISEAVCKCLKIFYEATCKFSGVKYPTSSIYFPIVCGIQQSISKWEDHELYHVQTMAQSMKAKFEKYWSECSLLMALGVILDPRFKLDFVEFYLNEIYGIGAESQLSRIRTSLRNLFHKYDDSTSSATSSFQFDVNNVSNSSATSTVDANCIEEFTNWYNQTRNVNTASQKSELERYLEEPIVQMVDFNILSWWSDNSPRFPTIGKIARDVLAVSISTVASESSFSVGGNIIEPSRHALGVDIVQALMCGQDWIELPKGKVTRRSVMCAGADPHPI